MPSPLRSLLAHALFFGLATLAGPAEAKCMQPSGALAPATGKVPSKPVLRLLLPEWQAAAYKGMPTLVARVKGKSVPIKVVADTTAADLRTYRVDVGAAYAGTLEVQLVDPSGLPDGTWTYEIDPSWTAPTTSEATVTLSHEVSAWTCSHTRTTSLHFAANAWAYRVVTAPTATLLGQGKVRSFVLPRAIEQFWGYDPTKLSSTSSVALGHASCFGDTFDWATPSVIADVYALQPDGSEQKVNAAPLVLPAP